MKNVFKNPEQYAYMLLDLADGEGSRAVDLLEQAERDYRLPQAYADAVAATLRGWIDGEPRND